MGKHLSRVTPANEIETFQFRLYVISSLVCTKQLSARGLDMSKTIILLLETSNLIVSFRYLLLLDNVDIHHLHWPH